MLMLWGITCSLLDVVLKEDVNSRYDWKWNYQQSGLLNAERTAILELLIPASSSSLEFVFRIVSKKRRTGCENAI